MWDVATSVTIAVGTSIASAIVWWVHRKYLRPLAELPAVQVLLVNLGAEVRKIKAEVQANGGKSLKDDVRAIRDDLAILEARQRALVGSSGRATFETDSHFHWRESNKAMERLVCTGGGHLVGRQWMSFIHDDDRGLVRGEIDHAVREKRGAGVSFRLVTDDGLIYVRLDAEPTFSRTSDQVLCWFGTMVKNDERRVEERRTV